MGEHVGEVLVEVLRCQTEGLGLSRSAVEGGHVTSGGGAEGVLAHRPGGLGIHTYADGCVVGEGDLQVPDRDTVLVGTGCVMGYGDLRDVSGGVHGLLWSLGQPPGCRERECACGDLADDEGKDEDGLAGFGAS